MLTYERVTSHRAQPQPMTSSRKSQKQRLRHDDSMTSSNLDQQQRLSDVSTASMPPTTSAPTSPTRARKAMTSTAPSGYTYTSLLRTPQTSFGAGDTAHLSKAQSTSSLLDTRSMTSSSSHRRKFQLFDFPRDAFDRSDVSSSAGTGASVGGASASGDIRRISSHSPPERLSYSQPIATAAGGKHATEINTSPSRSVESRLPRPVAQNINSNNNSAFDQKPLSTLTLPRLDMTLTDDDSLDFSAFLRK